MGGLLLGKAALVTGASRGIGAEIARLFAAEGARVGLLARDEDALHAVAAAIARAGGTACVLRADVTADGAIAGAITELESQLGPLDVAVNNAGAVHMPQRLAELSLDTFDRMHSAGARATFVAMQAEIRAMQARGGAIVNVVSTAGLRGAPGMGAYAATKHAIVGMTRTAALDYAPSDIRVNAVAPGPILTDRIAQLSDEQRAPIAAAVPMHRIGTPRDVADAVAWLASDRGAFITGAVLSVDGGRLAS